MARVTSNNTLKLTGPITSVGNTTSIASQTGTGTKFVIDTSPTIVTPTLTGTTILGGGDATATPVAASLRGAAASGTDIAGVNLTVDAANGTGSGGSGSIIFRTAPVIVASPVGVGNVSSANANPGTSITIAHTIANHNNQMLMVIIGGRINSTTINTVTWNGTNLTRKGQSFASTSNSPRTEIWYLLAPAQGNSNIVVTPSGNEYFSCENIDLYNVSQATPFGSYFSSQGNDNSPTMTVTGVISSNSLVVDGIAYFTTGSGATPTAGQTQISTEQGNSWRGTASYKTGSVGNVTMSWTTSATSDKRWAVNAIEVMPAGGSTANSLTEVLRFSPNTNVGINTTGPTAKLHIVGSSDEQQLIVAANATQTTNLQEWQNSSAGVLLSVSGLGSLNSAIAKTSVNGLTGTAVWSQPFQGGSYKKFLVYLTNFTSAGTVITFPTAFAKTPYVYGDAAAIAIAVTTTTTCTLTSVGAVAGFIIVEGY